MAFARTARNVVGAQEPDDGGNGGRGVARQRLCGHAGMEPRLTAAAADVHVAIDQPRDQSPPVEVERIDVRAEPRRQLGRSSTHPEHLAAAHEQAVAVA